MRFRHRHRRALRVRRWWSAIKALRSPEDERVYGERKMPTARGITGNTTGRRSAIAVPDWSSDIIGAMASAFRDWSECFTRRNSRVSEKARCRHRAFVHLNSHSRSVCRLYRLLPRYQKPPPPNKRSRTTINIMRVCVSIAYFLLFAVNAWPRFHEARQLPNNSLLYKAYTKLRLNTNGIS